MTSILVSPEKRNSELASQLERSGLRIIAWPPVQLDPALNQFALDDAIGNLFGYDWLILKSAPAAQFFLKRFTEAGRSVDELDGLRVWAIGEQTIASLRENQIHIDIEAEGRVSNRIVEALADYIGGHQLLSGLNFLLPSANITRETYQDRRFDWKRGLRPRCLYEFGSHGAMRWSAHQSPRPAIHPTHRLNGPLP